MIVTVEELQNYTEEFSDDTTLLESFIQTSQTVVENFIGYPIESADYTKVLSGYGMNFLNLGVSPINSITSIKIDGTEMDISRFKQVNEYLYFLDGVYTDGLFNIEIKFNGGFVDIPEPLKITVLRIAGVLNNEGRNVGIQSISDANTGSRTFMERDFDRYLKMVLPYRISKW